MDRTVPPGAALLLELIASIEAPNGYDTVYANRMDRMPKPLTSMTLAAVIADGPSRTRALGSSACGRYQFMTATLQDLCKDLSLSDTELLTPDLQDRLALRLLRRRGYDRFAARAITPTAFGLGLAQEWASFPVLADCHGAHRAVARGETFYAGDRLNKVLTRPETVEATLARVLAAGSAPPIAMASPSKATAPPAPTGGPSAPIPAPAAPRGFFTGLLATIRSNMKKVA